MNSLAVRANTVAIPNPLPPSPWGRLSRRCKMQPPSPKSVRASCLALVGTQDARRDGLVGAVQVEQVAAVRLAHALDPVVPLAVVRQGTFVALVGREHLERVLAR